MWLQFICVCLMVVVVWSSQLISIQDMRIRVYKVVANICPLIVVLMMVGL